MMIVIIFFAVLAVFLGVTCLCTNRGNRIVGAVVAFGWSCLMFIVAGFTQSLELNLWYSQAADELLESAVDAINTGDADKVAVELTTMREELKITYEERGNFNELAITTAERIRKGNQTNMSTLAPVRQDNKPK